MLEMVKEKVQAAFPDCRLEVVSNDSPSGQHSLLLGTDRAVDIARLLRDDAELCLDYCSNVTGVDWLSTEQKSGYLEAVYHLYSMEKKHGPVVIRLRTKDRNESVHLPSLTPVWRSCEFQEREIFDLYGIVFDGHPDLRRIFMWDEFQDYPMRKDYIEPDDYEYEPTAHDDVLAKARQHMEKHS